MDEPTVSVIIPVYRAERFLEECLNSIIGQDYPALEIILVDDGSPDSCPELCDRYAEAYDCIRTIHQSNQGPGMARNAGMEAAAGKYIAFLDSDDCLDGASAIRRMVEQAERRRADIVVGSFRRLEGGQFGKVHCHHLRDGAYTETADFRFKGFILYGHLSSACLSLYRSAFIKAHELKFRDYPFAEDKIFNMMCCTCKPVYAFVDESVYIYRANGGSITHRYWDGYISRWTAIFSDFEQFLSGRGMTEQYADLIAFHACIVLLYLVKQDLTHGKRMRETVMALSQYGKDPIVRKRLKEISRGRYIAQIRGNVWKVMMWGAALLCTLHAYALLVLGIKALQILNWSETHA